MYVTDKQLRKDGQPVGLNRRRVPAAARVFAAMLGALMEERRLTSADLADRLRYADSSTVGHILAARISFPTKRAEAFADALGLAGELRENFLDQAHLSVTSERVQDLVRRGQGAGRPVPPPDHESAPEPSTVAITNLTPLEKNP